LADDTHIFGPASIIFFAFDHFVSQLMSTFVGLAI
jgi:hypothetical protein